MTSFSLTFDWNIEIFIPHWQKDIHHANVYTFRLVAIFIETSSKHYFDEAHFPRIGDYSKLAIPVDWTGEKRRDYVHPAPLEAKLQK